MSHLPALLTVSALALSGASFTTLSTTTSPSAAAAKPECIAESTLGGARVMQGQSAKIDPNTLSQAQAAAMNRDLRQELRQSPTGARVDTNRRIDVYFHVITGNKKQGAAVGQGRGAVSNKRIRRQIDVMNKAFAGRTSPQSHGTRFRFVLRDIDRTRNPRWYDHRIYDGRTGKAEKNMKRTLHRGNLRDLNIYTGVPSYRKFFLLGYARFPNEPVVRRDPRMDGVNLLTASLPGGNIKGVGKRYSRGDTSTHEVGHWLGLFHTFQDGCGRRNDFVTDTPAEARPQFFCNKKYDTCNAPGLDPVHNFMDYGTDGCLTQFTSGQSDRMRLTWRAYRR